MRGYAGSLWEMCGKYAESMREVCGGMRDVLSLFSLSISLSSLLSLSLSPSLPLALIFPAYIRIPPPAPRQYAGSMRPPGGSTGGPPKLDPEWTPTLLQNGPENGSKIDPKMIQKLPKLDPKWTPGGHFERKQINVFGLFRVLGRPWAALGPKRPPRGSQEAPKSLPRGPQEASRRPQEAPRRPPGGPQEAPRGPQEHPKSPPRGPSKS